MAQPDPAEGRPRLPRDHLSRELILTTALGLVEEGGEAALSFRRLGAALSASPTSVYRHFRDKDELLLAMADRLLSDVVGERPAHQDWRATLRDIAARMHSAYLQHPRLAILVAGRSAVGEAELHVAEVILAALDQAGVPVEQRPTYYRAFEDTVLAWSCFDSTYVTTDPAARARDDDAWLTRYGSASPQRFPAVAAARPHVIPLAERAIFGLSVDLLIEAIAARFRPGRS